MNKRLAERLKEALYRRMALPQMLKTLALEESLLERDGAIHATDGSPVRFEIMRQEQSEGGPPLVARAAPHIAGSMLGIRKSLASLDENPEHARSSMSEVELGDLETYAMQLGISSIGYAKVPRLLIFQGKAIAHDNAIVLAMEMDWEKMELAPHPQTGAMVLSTYNRLGQASNTLARYLRERGYSAHAGHPLMGLTLYPPLARLAGMGWQGLHGLIITPEHGPRVRLAAVFTSIENLPFSEANPHSWVAEFCAVCRRCI